MSATKSQTKQIILIILGIIVVAGLGSLFVNLGMDWFGTLDRPTQWVPDIVIPIMWTIIYIIFGVILSRWVIKSSVPTSVYVWLIINGVLNVLWCLVFFTLKQTLGGNIIIVLNLIAGFMLWIEINKREPVYSYIIAIYPIWLSLATTLNTALWILN
ncbi:MAG: tryptophan-rich sensory protein [Clostridiales bacterium]|nr:tryptophan-rich sensory protein [Clostridiales bacterium]